MAEGDLLPKQAGFCQPFSPRPGSLLRGSLMQNAFKDKHPDGEYAIRRNGLTQVANASAIRPYSQGLAYLGSANSGYAPIGWLLNVDNGGSLNWTSQTATGSFGGMVTDGPNDYFSFIPAYTTTIPNFYGMISGHFGIAGVQNGGGGTLILTNVASPPTFMCPGLAFLDGTVYVMSAADNQIHGCNLQDPTTWPALNVVGASSSWGSGVAVSRHLNYVLGFYSAGLQVYYNAGLAPPGSPLAPLPNASFIIGCQAAESIVAIADCTFFVGSSSSGNLSVYMLQGLSLGIISNSFVDNILKDNAALFLQCVTPGTGPRSSFPPIRAYSLEDKGHSFYILKIAGVITLAFDTVNQEWNVWTSNVGGVEVPYIGDFAEGNFVAGSDAILSTAADTTYTDYSGPINLIVRTTVQDHGSAYKKFVQKLTVWGDNIPDTMTVRYSDNDYQTYSALITIDLSKERKMANRLGSFYRRSWEFAYGGNQPFRIKAYEILIRGGST